MNYWDYVYESYSMGELIKGMNDTSLLQAQRDRYEKEFNKRLDKKLIEVDEFEKRWGECTSSRAMRKYCTDIKYRQRVHQFNKASADTIKNHFNTI